MALSAEDLATATELTRAGRLMEATRAIQAALGMAPPPSTPSREPSDVIDVEAREILQDAALPAPARETAASPSAPLDAPARPAAFTSAHFSFGADRYRYRLFVPARAMDAAPLPVVVMLHGCKQDSADFALGTGMNALAGRQPAIVVYPEQLRKANTMGCWNWFEPAHQGRDAGEPAMIAALAQQVAQQHGGDPARIYVAGLSAGAAMAALLGTLYPDVFAAVGVHSGLPPGAAGDVASAFAAMRRGAAPQGASRAIPTIVFHGSGDKTVAPRNGEAVAQGQLAAWAAAGTPLAKSAEERLAAGRGALRTTWADAQGRPQLEVWAIDGGPHAWSGGQAGGSFTDPRGPDASAAMLAFFLQHRRAG